MSKIFIENKDETPQLLFRLRSTDGGRHSNINKDLKSDDRVGESGNTGDDEHFEDGAATVYLDFTEDEGHDGEECKKKN